MAFYPGHPSDSTAGKFGQDVSSVETLLDPIQFDYASNGKPRGRAFYTAPIRTFSIVHLLTQTDKTTLDTFYKNNRLVAFNFYYKPDSTTHTTCMFTAPPVYQIAGNGFWTCTMSISEVI